MAQSPEPSKRVRLLHPLRNVESLGNIEFQGFFVSLLLLTNSEDVPKHILLNYDLV